MDNGTINFREECHCNSRAPSNGQIVVAPCPSSIHTSTVDMVIQE
jgi:hypothetical protein